MEEGAIVRYSTACITARPSSTASSCCGKPRCCAGQESNSGSRYQYSETSEAATSTASVTSTTVSMTSGGTARCPDRESSASRPITPVYCSTVLILPESRAPWSSPRRTDAGLMIRYMVASRATNSANSQAGASPERVRALYAHRNRKKSAKASIQRPNPSSGAGAGFAAAAASRLARRAAAPSR